MKSNSLSAGKPTKRSINKVHHKRTGILLQRGMRFRAHKLLLKYCRQMWQEIASCFFPDWTVDLVFYSAVVQYGFFPKRIKLKWKLILRCNDITVYPCMHSSKQHDLWLKTPKNLKLTGWEKRKGISWRLWWCEEGSRQSVGCDALSQLQTPALKHKGQRQRSVTTAVHTAIKQRPV